MASNETSTRFAHRLGSRVTKLTLGFAVVAGRTTKQVAKDLADGARQAAAEYRSTVEPTTETATRDDS